MLDRQRLNVRSTSPRSSAALPSPGDSRVVQMGRQASPNGGRADECEECGGTGLVVYWNEVAYFDDRRFCTLCGAGREMYNRIGQIIDEGQHRDRLAG